MKAQKLYLGNIVTMNETKPVAEAICVADGKILYVGSEKTARTLCDENTEVIDLGENTIYPGFMEAHCHPMGAGKLLDVEALCDVSAGESLEDYVKILAEFIAKYPNRKNYSGHGFMERDVKPVASMLDAICADKPVMLMTTDGHSMWLNTKAMEIYGLDQEAAKEYGPDTCRVFEDGTPTGYISENPVFDIRAKQKTEIEDGVRALLTAQNFFFSKGYTAIYDAGMELTEKTAPDIYEAAVAGGKYKLRTYAGSMIDEFCEDIDGAVEKISRMQTKYNNEYFKIIGVKTFADGVIEGHTALLEDGYNDQPGYKGVSRLTDHDKLVQLYTSAALHDMNVHVHAVGDGAIRCNLDAMEVAAANTGRLDQRNALAHLQQVRKEDIQRFADLNVMAVVAPLWTPKHPDYFLQEIEYVGKERAENAYPVKSFAAAGANIAFHTDFPVSRNVSIPNTIYTAVMRRNSGSDPSCTREADEFITRYQAVEGLTKNVAYMWHEENRLGTLEIGKIANMSVYDKNFLTDDLEEVGASNLVCTIVDGEIVYKA
ncbi:MAG: amidohydrolase [Lachnospiraceae bacterium]|nr:amidohydrolase [Lachnospiraceae bacterium]